jgi:hypothetical protein
MTLLVAFVRQPPRGLRLFKLVFQIVYMLARVMNKV